MRCDHRSRRPSQREEPKMEEGAMSQGVQPPPDAAKVTEWSLPWSLQKEHSPAHPGFQPRVTDLRLLTS